MPVNIVKTKYPAGLLEWAGHRSGGVRRIFDESSGRPAGAVLETPLLARLRAWADAIVTGVDDCPRIVLLIGGPGNGKTEAVEDIIARVDGALEAQGVLVQKFRHAFNPHDGQTVPRLFSVDLDDLGGHQTGLLLTLVQDASVSDASGHQSPASLLVNDLEQALRNGSKHLYMACVNRGVLDEALIFSIDHRRTEARAVLEDIVRSVSMSLSAPSCWPLSGNRSVAIWPMDVESLLVQRSEAPSAASRIIALATDEQSWPSFGTCAAGERCPFCRNRMQLSGTPHGLTFIQILRWYELATGKRWSFRDLFTLMSYLLAGSPASDKLQGATPCEWAAELLGSGARPGIPERIRTAAPFLLMASQYQHVLFGQWSYVPRRGIRASMRDLKIQDDPTLTGLHHFLSGVRADSIPATLRAQLANMCHELDPALADPDSDAEVSSRTTLRLREVDSRFSRSVKEGLQFIRKYQCLSPLEIDVLSRLALSEEQIASPEVARRKPATAARLQMFLRDFAGRIVRRSIGARSAVVRNHTILADFDRVVTGDEQGLALAAKQVESLLNEDDRFVVSLNTTFGQPLPPPNRRVTLTTPKQKVKPSRSATVGRPLADIHFLTIGGSNSGQSIPLTYELFHSVRDLRAGMLPASLPRTVTALLDATRARLAGRVVRDEEQLDGAEIAIGTRSEKIMCEGSRFIVRNDGDTQ